MSSRGIAFDDPAVLADPYPHYARLRADAPVHWDPAEEAWLLTRHRDVVQALRDPRLSARTDMSFIQALPEPLRTEAAPLARHFEAWMLFADPPGHTPLRESVAEPLSRHVTQAVRTVVEPAADEVIDRAGRTGSLDVVGEYAMSLCRLGLASIMGRAPDLLGNSDEWARELLEFINVDLDPDQTRRATRCLHEMSSFVDRMTEDGGQPGGVAAMLRDHTRTGTLSGEQPTAILSQIYTGALGPAPFLVGNAMLALTDQPDELDRLRLQPELIDQAVEEFLRYDSPFLQVPRTAIADIELHQIRIQPGDRVGLMLAAANWDPAEFDRPDRLDIGRSPNRHLAFGLGTHYCLGATFTRLIARIAIGKLVARFGHIERAQDRVIRRPLFGMRGPDRLELRVAD